MSADRPSRTAHHGNRHGRSEQARRAVLEAADDLLAERGFAGVTIEGIAARAGVAKQTIYRWWSSKVDVLIEAFVDDMAQHLTPPDEGDLESELRTHLRRSARFLTRSDPGAVFRALAGQAQHDPEMAERFRTECLGPQRALDRRPLERAIERGELPPDTDVDFALDQLVGPLYYRVLVTGHPVPEEFTDALVERFLAPFRTRRAAEPRA
ncbi:TetR/AcrR family transcriptional regulator [Actinoallomurus acaciae]|uniref:TetR/AcrR family transcriptional regulator n=1 Tax=Actinoallomurus acaciae TaxID=502577 RepID=A0ABV5YVV1_9ACTN